MTKMLVAVFRAVNSSFTEDFCPIIVVFSKIIGLYFVYIKKRNSESKFMLRFADESDVINYLTLFYSEEEVMRGFVYVLPGIDEVLDTYEQYENQLDDNNQILRVVEYANHKKPLNYAGCLQVLRKHVKF